MMLLQVKDFSVSYGRVVAVRGIDFSVDEGEAVGVIGPNGAGKTSILWGLTGIAGEVRGSVTLAGESLIGCSPEERVRRGVALVPEGCRVFGNLKIRENLELGRTAALNRESAKTIEDVVNLFPALRRYLDLPAAGLSGGERQQLAIARALLSDPRILLLDEPSFGLGPQVVETVFNTLDRLRQEGVTVLLIEQNAVRAADFAERVYVLRDGEIQQTIDASTDISATDMAALYMGTE